VAVTFSNLIEKILLTANPNFNKQRAYVWSLIIYCFVRKIIDYPNLRLGQFIHDVLMYYFKGTLPKQLPNILFYITEEDFLSALTNYFDMMDASYAKKTFPRI